MYCKYKQQTLFFYFSMVHITNNMEFQFKRSETGTNCGAFKFIVHRMFCLSMSTIYDWVCVWRVLCFCYFLRSFPFVTLHLLAIQYRFYFSLSLPIFSLFPRILKSLFCSRNSTTMVQCGGKGEKYESDSGVHVPLLFYLGAAGLLASPLYRRHHCMPGEIDFSYFCQAESSISMPYIFRPYN